MASMPSSCDRLSRDAVSGNSSAATKLRLDALDLVAEQSVFADDPDPSGLDGIKPRYSVQDFLQGRITDVERPVRSRSRPLDDRDRYALPVLCNVRAERLQFIRRHAREKLSGRVDRENVAPASALGRVDSFVDCAHGRASVPALCKGPLEMIGRWCLVYRRPLRVGPTRNSSSARAVRRDEGSSRLLVEHQRIAPPDADGTFREP